MTASGCQYLIASVGRVAKGRQGDRYVIMILVGYFEYHFNKRVKAVLLLAFKVRADMVSQLVDSPVVVCVRQEVVDPAVPVGCFFCHECPVTIVALFVQTDFDIRGRIAGIDVENVARQLVGLALRIGGQEGKAQR